MRHVSSVRPTVCRVPLRQFLFATITASVLFLSSCRTTKTVKESSYLQLELQDSARQVWCEIETRETARQYIAGDSVRLSVPLEMVMSLPPGAAYTEKSGRTRVTVQRNGEHLAIVGETDSVGADISRYERRARDSLSESLRKASRNCVENRQTREHTDGGLIDWFTVTSLAWGVISVAALLWASRK